MLTLGLWPFRPNNLIFFINFGYFSFLMIMEYLDLFLFIGDLEHVIMNLTENMAFSQIFVRMSMLRLYNGQIGEVIAEAMKDFNRSSYRTVEEMKMFITYNARSKIFVKLLMVFVALTASSYYLTPIFIILGSGELRFTFMWHISHSKKQIHFYIYKMRRNIVRKANSQSDEAANNKNCVYLGINFSTLLWNFVNNFVHPPSKKRLIL